MSIATPFNIARSQEQGQSFVGFRCSGFAERVLLEIALGRTVYGTTLGDARLLPHQLTMAPSHENVCLLSESPVELTNHNSYNFTSGPRVR